MDKKTIVAIFERFKRANPHPTTELLYHNPFELLIAVILSAQATDQSVNKATRDLFKVANTPETMSALGETRLKKYIQSIGLYQNKAKFIIATSKRLITDFQSSVPDNREDLESLPGVGRKTANVILNTCYHELTMAVDTHIFRVANRIGLAHGKTPLAVETQLVATIPATYLLHAHHWLILHGRYVCIARKPKCGECLISKWCEYPNKTVV
jgi:endonuclease III